METIRAFDSVVRVQLGDGTVRVEAGETLSLSLSPPHTNGGISAVAAPGWETWSAPPEKKPDRPPPLALGKLALGKRWYFVGDCDVGECVESRAMSTELEDGVVVFRDGLSMPKGELVRVVNTAHAVLVQGEDDEYSYLRGDFVLSAREEEALGEWGLGRPLFANSCLAAGGTLLVAFAEEVWRPAAVGTLMVAAAVYSVQGALTKVLRVLSAEWDSEVSLVPSGIHGVERVVQLVLLTLVALGDLLDDRVLQLTGLICASAQVILSESVGQAVLTWGSLMYRGVLSAQVGVWTLVCAGMVAFVWLTYVFAGAFSCVLCGNLLMLPLSILERHGPVTPRDHSHRAFMSMSGMMITGMSGWFAHKDWDEADVKFSMQSLQPWRWPLFRTPDSLLSGLRAIGLWFGVVVACLFVAYVVVGLLSFRISSDTSKPRGKRTRARKEKGVFSHYHASPIPSRNLLVPDVTV